MEVGSRRYEEGGVMTTADHREQGLTSGQELQLPTGKDLIP